MTTSNPVFCLKNVQHGNYASVDTLADAQPVSGWLYSNSENQLFTVTDTSGDFVINAFPASPTTYYVVPTDLTKRSSGVSLNSAGANSTNPWVLESVNNSAPNAFRVKTTDGTHVYYWTLESNKDGTPIKLDTELAAANAKKQHWILEVNTFSG